MSEPPILLSEHQGVATITLNRPRSMNALDTPTKDALLTALQDVSADPDIRCVVLTGSGRAFCAGQDLKEHLALLEAGDLDALWSTVPDHYNPIALTIYEMAKPTVAAVNGIASGAGASLAFLTDYRVLAASAGIDVAFARIGLSCDTGTSWTLPRLVGPTRAMDLLLNPRTITAPEALDIGIASEVVDDATFPARVTELATQLASGPTLAYAAIRRSVAFSAANNLSDSLAFEGEMMRRTGASSDHQAAVDSFLAKRPAEFRGQ